MNILVIGAMVRQVANILLQCKTNISISFHVSICNPLPTQNNIYKNIEGY